MRKKSEIVDSWLIVPNELERSITIFYEVDRLKVIE